MTATLTERPKAERRHELPLLEVRAVGGSILTWKQRGACFGDNDDTMYPQENEEQREVAQRCQLLCPVQSECLAYALETGQRHGVWGGLTERELAKLRRSRA